MKVECTCGYLMDPERIKLHEHRQRDGLVERWGENGASFNKMIENG
ncbi:MAG: hypothetical protein PHG07_09070 [Lachnospiraceae bacterium]|nr:hypothetical protein [Lachnospiraceae bacterium]